MPADTSKGDEEEGYEEVFVLLKRIDARVSRIEKQVDRVKTMVTEMRNEIQPREHNPDKPARPVHSYDCPPSE